MKFIEAFSSFMDYEVNLNKTRIDIIEKKVETIDTLLQNIEEYSSAYIDLIPQGSYRHKTIIKPSEKNPEFDVDVVLYIRDIPGWEPRDYIEKLYCHFRGDNRYSDIVRRKTRCLTIDYKGEFHLDIVPCIVRELAEGKKRYYVLNRNDNVEEETDGTGYAKWFEECCGKVKNDYLIETVRLFKYLRDIKQTFSAKSVLLTTLLANQVEKLKSSGLDSNDIYSDLPTTFKHIVISLNDFLQENPIMPTICNPVLSNENFNRHWDQDRYNNFRNFIQKYTDWIIDAYDEADELESKEKWRRIFGERFADNAVDSKNFSGLSYSKITHYEKPRWRILTTEQISLTAIVYDGTSIISASTLVPGSTVGINKSIQYEVHSRFAAHAVDVYWQVVNTGDDAYQANGLRGNIFKGNPDNTNKFKRQESTKYRGIHWIECFVVPHGYQNKICAHRSERFFIRIE